MSPPALPGEESLPEPVPLGMDADMPAHHFMRRRIMQQNQLQGSLASSAALQARGSSGRPPASQAGPQAQVAAVELGAEGQASRASLQMLRSGWKGKLKKSLSGMLKRSPSDAEGSVKVGGSLALLHAGCSSYLRDGWVPLQA